MSGRRREALNVTDAERSELIALAARLKTEQALASRARIILACAEGLENQAVGQQREMHPQTRQMAPTPSGAAGPGVPYGIRTRVTNVKGWCPGPLDERDAGRPLGWPRRRARVGSGPPSQGQGGTGARGVSKGVAGYFPARNSSVGLTRDRLKATQ